MILQLSKSERTRCAVDFYDASMKVRCFDEVDQEAQVLHAGSSINVVCSRCLATILSHRGSGIGPAGFGLPRLQVSGQPKMRDSTGNIQQAGGPRSSSPHGCLVERFSKNPAAPLI